MGFIHRSIEHKIRDILSRDKSILLLGPRQTGKTTLLRQQLQADLEYSFIDATLRRRYEANPGILLDEIKAHRRLHPSDHKPVVLIDEVQKVPAIMDTVQAIIDDQLAIFVLTGSSARKLKRGSSNQDINLLPGRVIELHMDALSISEMQDQLPSIEDLLLNGSLPEIVQQRSAEHKEELLNSYVNIYLEEEIRAEAIVRNLGHFSRFLNYAAIDAGNEANLANLANELGIARNTIIEYYQILLDCLIVNRIDPITQLVTRRRLTKSSKYLFFDLGIRRIAAGEGLRLPQKYYGDLFEQFIGIELVKLLRYLAPQAKLKYWHDHNGPEVDYVIEYNRQYIPIEVKWTSAPTKTDARHLTKFIDEYDCVTPAYIICQTPRPMEITEQVLAIHWSMLPDIIGSLLE